MGGLTFSNDSVYGMSKDLFPDTWWFGFDTAHHGDKKLILSDIDLQFPSLLTSSEYRDMEYVINETKRLAEQLKEFE